MTSSGTPPETPPETPSGKRSGPARRWIGRHINLSRSLAVLGVIAIAPIAEFLWGTVLGDYIDPGEEEEHFKIYAFAPLTDSNAPILFRDIDRGLSAAKERFFGADRRWRERYEIELVIKNTRARPDRLKGWLEHLAQRNDVLAAIIIEEEPNIRAAAPALAALPFAQLYPLAAPQGSALVYRMMTDGVGEAGEILALIEALGRKDPSLVALLGETPAALPLAAPLEDLSAGCTQRCIRLAGHYALDDGRSALSKLDRLDPDFLIAHGDLNHIADFAARSRRAMRRHRYILSSETLLRRGSRRLPDFGNGVLLMPASGGDGRALLDKAGIPDLSYLAEDAVAILARALEEYDDLPPERAGPLSRDTVEDLLSQHSFRGRAGEYRFDADGYNINARLLAFEPDGKSARWRAIGYP